MNSPGRSESNPIDLSCDVTTTPEDVVVLRRLRRESPSWFSLTPAQLADIIPDDALDRRRVMNADAKPFELP
jgi:hypothetical protein